MTDESNQPTVEVDENALAQFIIFAAMEWDNWDVLAPKALDTETMWDGIHTSNVDYVDSYGDEVEVGGSFTVPEIVGRIPAGPNRGYGPINPPEVITEDREAHFVIRFKFEDEGYATGTIEVY